MRTTKRSLLWGGILACLVTSSSPAFPPAPDHVIYGLVRDEMGDPIVNNTVTVYLETTAGVRLATQISAGLDASVNFKLSVPMDSGLTADQYQPTALLPAAPFRMWVVAGGKTNLPIEMTVNTAALGRPGGQTRINLTLGVDANGDGLPDAWEQSFITALGLKISLADLKPGSDPTGSGMTVMQQYLAGTYAINPADGFSVKIAAYNAGVPVLEFTGITGRTYSVLGSQDATHWSPIAFRLSGSSDPVATEYYSSSVQKLRVEIPSAGAPTPAYEFYKLMVR